jgi:hypothetical protein
MIAAGVVALLIGVSALFTAFILFIAYALEISCGGSSQHCSADPGTTVGLVVTLIMAIVGIAGGIVLIVRASRGKKRDSSES